MKLLNQALHATTNNKNINALMCITLALLCSKHTLTQGKKSPQEDKKQPNKCDFKVKLGIR